MQGADPAAKERLQQLEKEIGVLLDQCASKPDETQDNEKKFVLRVDGVDIPSVTHYKIYGSIDEPTRVDVSLVVNDFVELRDSFERFNDA